MTSSTTAVPDVSYVVVLTRNARRASAAIRSIAAQTPTAELMLVLNEPDAEMSTFAHGVAEGGAKILHEGADIGIANGWNLGLREAHAQHVCTVHEDSELYEGCAERQLRTLRERPEAGEVGARAIWPNGSGKDGAIVWNDGAASANPLSPEPGVRPVDYSGTSCLMLSREAVLGVGGFNQRFFPAIYVDASLAIALWQAGRTCLCDSRAIHAHRTGAMVDEARGPRRSARMRRFLIERNRVRFREVFAGWLSEQVPRSNAVDASNPTQEEILDAQARARAREQRVLEAPVTPLSDRLVIPADMVAEAEQLRRELEDEFMAELIERERSLGEEAADVHRKYAELHAELVRVHREYALLWEDRERLIRGASAVAGGEHA